MIIRSLSSRLSHTIITHTLTRDCPLILDPVAKDIGAFEINRDRLQFRPAAHNRLTGL